MADWWTQSGTTSTAEGANGPVLAGAGTVTSERASTNLVTRAITVTIGTTSGVAFGSSDAVLWTAPTPVTLTSIKVVPYMNWVVATSGDVLEFWSCTAGAISSKAACSTGLFGTAGSITTLTLNSSAVDLAACESLRFKMSLPGTTSCCKPSHVQINYVTTG